MAVLLRVCLCCCRRGTSGRLLRTSRARRAAVRCVRPLCPCFVLLPLCVRRGTAFCSSAASQLLLHCPRYIAAAPALPIICGAACLQDADDDAAGGGGGEDEDADDE